MRRIKKYSLYILIIIILAGMGYGFFKYQEYRESQALQYEIAQTGILKHEVYVKAIYANEEAVIQSSSSGKLNLLVDEGQRVRRGDPVFSIESPALGAGNQNITVQAPMGGLLSLTTDGLENLFTHNHFLDMDLAELLNTPRNEQRPEQEVQLGQVIGKIVNNLGQTTAFVEMPSVKDIGIGDILKFELNSKSYSGTVLRKTDNPLGVVVQFNTFVDASLYNREEEMIWLSSPSMKGVLVPKSALWIRGEEKGVYAVVNGVIRYQPVVVLDENETHLCVDNLAAGTKVVINPREGIEGRVP